MFTKSQTFPQSIIVLTFQWLVLAGQTNYYVVKSRNPDLYRMQNVLMNYLFFIHLLRLSVTDIYVCNLWIWHFPKLGEDVD